MVEMGPKQVEVERDPKDTKMKNRKRVQSRRSRGARLGGPSKWSRSNNQRRARVARVPVERRQRGEDGSECNATIVAEIISCMTTRNIRRLRKSSVPPREIKCLAPFAHMDGSPGWKPWTNRRQRRRRQAYVPVEYKL